MFAQWGFFYIYQLKICCRKDLCLFPLLSFLSAYVSMNPQTLAYSMGFNPLITLFCGWSFPRLASGNPLELTPVSFWHITFEHLTTFLYKMNQAHLTLFWKSAILSRSSGSIYETIVFLKKDLGSWHAHCYGCKCYHDLWACQRFSVKGDLPPPSWHMAVSENTGLSQLRKYYCLLVGRGQRWW